MYFKFAEVIAVLPVALSEYCIGLEYGWISPTIKYLKEPNEDLHLNGEEISWVASLHELGRILGPFLVPVFARFFGRKRSIIVVALGHVLCWAGVSFTRSIWVLYGARLLIGVVVGISDVVTCIYVGEVSSPAVRGRSMTVIHALYLSGVLSAYIFGTYLTYSVHALTILAFSMLIVLSCSLLTETPQYLISVGREELAKKNLTTLRGGMCIDDVQSEFEAIKKSLDLEDRDKLSVWKALRNPIHIRVVCLATAVLVLGHLTGFLSITYYSNIIFPSNDLLTSNQFTVIFGATQVLAVCASSVFVELYGRRFLLMTFASCAMVLHLATASLYFLKEKTTIEIPGFSWLVFGTIALYSALFSFGCSPTNFVLRSELFPLHLKGIGGALSVLLQSAFIFLQTKLFMTIVQLFGIYCNFLIYALFAFVILLVTFLYLPETKGKSLAEIQSHFHSKYERHKFTD